jgi:hypothetical protein
VRIKPLQGRLLAVLASSQGWRILVFDSAYMELVKSNAQGELTNLEIGIHALGSVEKSNGGNNSKGQGLVAYATEIGKSKASLSEWIGAAKVYLTVSTCEQLRDLPRHLYETSKADPRAWACLVEQLIQNQKGRRNQTPFLANNQHPSPFQLLEVGISLF